MMLFVSSRARPCYFGSRAVRSSEHLELKTVSSSAADGCLWLVLRRTKPSDGQVTTVNGLFSHDNMFIGCSRHVLLLEPKKHVGSLFSSRRQNNSIIT